MQIRCRACTRTIAIAPDGGALPSSCPHCSAQPLPERLGRYRLDRLLATGGMGEVYLAHHEQLGTEVALKLLPAVPLDRLADVQQRFAREARLTARVEHPGVVRVLDSAAEHDRPYLVLELVRGRTLRDVLASGPLPSAQAAGIAAETADVVAAAHRCGVLHRDIKPDNVMLQPDGRVRVLDFGLARALATDDAPLTRTGEVLGTPEYMAPEQLLEAAEATDERTDVHALGVLLYELLSARSPFRSGNLFQTLKLVESLDPPPPTTGGGEAAAALGAVVQRAMQKRPEDRFATAHAFAAAVRQAEPAAKAPAATPLPARRSQLLPAAALAVLLAAATAALGFVVGRGGDPGTAEPLDGAPQQAGGVDLDAVRVALRAALHDGRLHHVMTRCAEVAPLATGDDAHELRRLRRAAFAFAHTVLPRALRLPPWLAVTDLEQRRLLFGDLLEPVDSEHPTAVDALLGDLDALRTLAPRRAGPSTRTTSERLLALAAASATDEAELAELTELAELLPPDEPEHWLVRCVLAHRRDAPAEAEQAAETAWLLGAGERAVLFDAILRAPTADAATRDRLWRRVGAADPRDCPASSLLLLAIAAGDRIRRVHFEPAVAHDFPTPHRRQAAAWFVAAADATEPDGDRAERRCFQLLQIAAALGARPDFDTAPWSRVPAARRDRLSEDARDGR